MLLIIALTVRVAAVLMIWVALLLVRHQLPAPGASALLAVLLTVTTGLIVAVWLRQRRVDLRTLALDVPAAALAILAGAMLDASVAEVGWTDFTYPYTLLISLGFGLSLQRLRSMMLVGSVLGCAYAAGAVLADGVEAFVGLGGALGYLINPLVGLLVARLLRRMCAGADSARSAAVADAATLSAARERSRHARALHDRVLQTMEMLAHGQSVRNVELRAQVVEQAAWLRRFVETCGEGPLDEDLPSMLAAAVRVAATSGVTVQLNDAGIRTVDVGRRLTQTQRDVLVYCVHHLVATLAHAESNLQIRAVPDAGGVLLTVLHRGHVRPVCPVDIATLQARLREVGGWLLVDPTPYVELWVPAGAVI